MQYSPVTKLSSFGKGLDSDLANARYIGRFGTLQDEMGNTLNQHNKAVLQRLDLCPNQNKSSFRVIVSLPATDADKAKDIALDEIRNRYSSFLVAYHEKNDKGAPQPHLHALIFNDQKNHPLKDRNEIFNLRQAIGERFRTNNISFPATKEGLKPKRTQAEIHMRERGQTPWLDDIRNAVESALSHANDFDSFVSVLSQHGITISRQTAASLTFQDAEGRTARLDRLFSRMKNRKDIEAEIAKNNISTDRLRQAEALFLNRLTKTAEALKYQGMKKEDIQNRINNILSYRANIDAVSERWEALKTMKSNLDAVMTREQLKIAKQQMYQQQRLKRHQSKMLRKALRAGNPIAAFALGITYIINAIATRHGDINRDGITEDYITELLKTKQTLKQPTPEPNRMAPGN